jgi:hypothetical protein
VQPDTERLAAFLAGFVAGEGCFSGSGRRFVFEIGLGAVDRGICEVFQEFLGVGHIYDSPRRREHYDDETSFMVQSLRELVEVVVPFMDAHLHPSYKRKQYNEWRGQLLDYWEHKAKRVRPCRVDGCLQPRLAEEVCRDHLCVQDRM